MGSNRRLDRGTAATLVIEDLRKRQRNRSSAEASHDAGDHLAQRIEMISAFQSHRESAPAETGREGRAPGHEFDVTGGGQDERRERVAVVRIDPEAHEDPIRPELLDDRFDDPVMSREVRSVSTPRRERDVHRESAAVSRPHVLGETRARENAVLVRGEIQDGRVVGEDVARPVPVMGVVVQDGDPHHGNGTRDIFADNASVLYLSTHEYGIFPGTGLAEDVGTGDGRGFTVNIPFSAGCGDASYLAAHDRIVEPIVEQFRPDGILVSLGIDAHYRDPLTSLVLSSPGYVELVARSAALATRLCGNRLAVALEGGYHLDALGEVFTGVVGHFRGRSTRLALSEVLDDKGRGGRASEGTIRTHRPFWNLR